WLAPVADASTRFGARAGVTPRARGAEAGSRAPSSVSAARAATRARTDSARADKRTTRAISRTLRSSGVAASQEDVAGGEGAERPRVRDSEALPWSDRHPLDVAESREHAAGRRLHGHAGERSRLHDALPDVLRKDAQHQQRKEDEPGSCRDRGACVPQRRADAETNQAVRV